MNNKKCVEELKEIVQKSYQNAIDCSDDEEIEIVVADTVKPPPVKHTPKEDALSFWMNRVKHKAKENCVTIDGPAPQRSALLSSKLPTTTVKVTIPIVTHQKERERSSNPEVINVEEASAKINAKKYKNSLFGPQEKKASWTESQQARKKRLFQRQIEIIESSSQPRWKQEKQRREELNRYKYPVSSIGSYGYDHHPGTRGFDTYNEATWQDYERKREIKNQKNKEKQEEERRKEKERQKELKLQKRKDEEAHFQSFADGLFGTKKQKNEVSDVALQESLNDMEKAAEQAERQRQVMKENIAAEDVDEVSPEVELWETFEPRIPRYGIKDIIKVSYSPYISEIVRAVLSHNYRIDLPIVESKKIPDIFEDGPSAYKRIFHFLIANQSIADVSQRMRKAEKDKNSNSIKIQIQNLKLNKDDQTEIIMKQVKDPSSQNEKKSLLLSFSLSRLRIGLISNQIEYRREHYGISENSDSFGLLVVLVTPETKDEMQHVKALGKFKPHDLEMVFKKRNSRQAYFYDLDKLSTIYREYQAVSHMPLSDLAPVLLDPRLMDREMGAYVNRKDVLSDILTHLQSIFNQTQSESIREMVLREKGIVMLQGPPGTGKTSTLMGLLSAQYEYLKKTNDNRKIMICAPSNAAVDHIVRRLLNEGLFNGEGQIIYPNALRVGIVDTLDETVRAVSLDDLCEKRALKETEEKRLTSTQIKVKLQALRGQFKKFNKPGFEKEYNELKQNEIKYEQMLFTFRQEKVVTARKNYRFFESQLLASADIILTTLSSSGNERLDQLRGEIACLIIDEAAQATEPNLLIALQTGVQKVLLIGDPYQLPATCMSSDCNVTLFNRSLFERFLDAGIKPYFLNIQYRMAPLIRHFPSRRFYQNRLVDAASVAERACPPFLNGFHHRNVAFVDVKYGREELRGDSFMNEAEGRTVGTLVRCLLWSDISLGIITPYQAQRSVINRECKNELKNMPEDLPNYEKNVMINTVDSFQGQERDIIIVSTVRANNRQHLGFLTDERRINVTLTRSKFLLIIVGNGDTLGGNEVWNDFLEWAEREKVYYELNSPTEITAVLKSVFQSNNARPVNRKRYSQFSTDIRRKDRKQMELTDTRSKKAHEKMANKLSHLERVGSSGDKEQPLLKTHAVEPATLVGQPASSKYALDIKESQKIRDEKRQKEKEAEEFEAINESMRRTEQMLKKDKTYDFMFPY